MVKNLDASCISMDEHAANISWEPPDMLTLPSGSNFVSYIVTIQNKFSGYEYSQVTNETEYIFRQQGIEECTPYNISVQAQNLVGIGAIQEIKFTFSG